MDRLNEILGTYKYPLLMGLVGSVLIFSGSFAYNPFTSHTQIKDLPKESITNASSTAGMIKVDIAGAVNKPGVYDLSKETRVDELVKKAGGFHPEANAEYIAKQLNLSQKISDGQKIYIPFQGESNVGSGVVAGISTTAAGVQGKINLNSSTQSQLEELPGVGPSTAQKIISARPYAEITELSSKKIVGKAVYEKIKELVEI